MTASLSSNEAKKALKESGNHKNVRNAMKLVSSHSGTTFSSIFGIGTTTVTKNKNTKEKHWIIALLEKA
jgi:hypothetical protein